MYNFFNHSKSNDQAMTKSYAYNGALSAWYKTSASNAGLLIGVHKTRAIKNLSFHFYAHADSRLYEGMLSLSFNPDATIESTYNCEEISYARSFKISNELLINLQSAIQELFSHLEHPKQPNPETLLRGITQSMLNNNLLIKTRGGKSDDLSLSFPPFIHQLTTLFNSFNEQLKKQDEQPTSDLSPP